MGYFELHGDVRRFPEKRSEMTLFVGGKKSGADGMGTARRIAGISRVFSYANQSATHLNNDPIDCYNQ